MKTRIQSATLGQQVPAGHHEIGSVMSISRAAKEWAKSHPNPYAYGRKGRKGGGK